MSAQILAQTTTELQYLQTLRSNIKTYIQNLIEEKILLNKAREASKSEREERRKVLSSIKEAIEGGNYGSLKEAYASLGRLNRQIAEKERPFKEEAKPFKESKNQAFKELITNLVLNGDLPLQKAVEVGLVKMPSK
jgi:hypothetical protein